MKRITILIVFLVAFSQIINAQLPKKTKQATKASFVYHQPKNCSPYTALLLSNLKQKRSADYLIEHFNLMKSDNETYVSAFIKTDGRLDKSLLAGYGVKLNTQVGNIYTSLIPINQLEDVLSIEGLEYLEIGQKVEPQLDAAREQTRVNWVHNGTDLSQAYTGDGVVVGVIDGGFDYTHPTFYDADYAQYRISRAWEQGENGTPPAPFDYGNELIGQTTILNNANDGTNAGSHGTHVAGIAAGSGSALSDNTYKGIAYESEIVLVSTTMQTTGIADGVYYIFDYAASVNKPAVINMSIGGHIGPHDGTSMFDTWSDGIVGEGRILVGAAGNEGSAKLHLDYDFGAEETIYSFITFPGNTEHPSAGATFIDIWGEVGSDFTIAVNVYNIESDEYEAYTEYFSTSTDGSYNVVLQDNDLMFSDEVPVSIVVEHSNPNNNKPHVEIYFDNTDQDESGDIYDYVMLEVVGTNTSFDAWCKSGIFTNFGNTSPIIDGNTNSTVGEIGGTGNSIISVGAYSSKNSYTDFQGNQHSFAFEVGEIASFSSLGPTADGRIKPDITAPGNKVISSVNSFDANYTSTSSKVVAGINSGADSWWFATMQGTSMASPMVAGIVALWLEANQTLTPSEIKQLMQNNSWTDAYTGSVPNNTWGYGACFISSLQSKSSSCVQNTYICSSNQYKICYVQTRRTEYFN